MDYEINWTQVGETDGPKVTLKADPIPRVIPDGVTVIVDARSSTEERGWNPREIVEVREAYIQIDADAPVRFGTMESDPRNYIWAKEHVHPSPWWGYGGSGGMTYRAGGFMAGDLPEGALKHLRAVLYDAARCAGEHFPQLWDADKVKTAEREASNAFEAMEKAQQAYTEAALNLEKVKAKYGVLS